MPVPTNQITAPLKLMGVAGSPYTRKMRAVLRFRGIPYRMIRQGSLEAQALPEPKVRLLPTFYLPDEKGVELAVTDSTPLEEPKEPAQCTGYALLRLLASTEEVEEIAG